MCDDAFEALVAEIPGRPNVFVQIPTDKTLVSGRLQLAHNCATNQTAVTGYEYTTVPGNHEREASTVSSQIRARQRAMASGLS